MPCPWWAGRMMERWDLTLSAKRGGVLHILVMPLSLETIKACFPALSQTNEVITALRGLTAAFEALPSTHE